MSLNKARMNSLKDQLIQDEIDEANAKVEAELEKAKKEKKKVGK